MVAQSDASEALTPEESQLLAELQGESIYVPEFPAALDGLSLTAQSEGVSPQSTTDAGKVYLAFGDSISTGYQPGGSHLTSEAFAHIIAAARGYTLVNEAVDGNTCGGIYAQIKGGALDAKIKSATLITITCGGNDIVGALYQGTADAYNTSHSSEPHITAKDVRDIIYTGESDSRYSDVLTQVVLLLLNDFSNTTLFTDTLDSFKDNLVNVMTYLHNVNPDATIVVETQYNPYQWLGGLYDSFVSEPVDAGIVKLNDVILSPRNGAGTKYLVADSHTVFAASTTSLSCASGKKPQSFDFHPNVQGHSLIAATMQGVMPGSVTCSAASPKDLVYNGTAQSLGTVTVTTPATGATVTYGTTLGIYDLTSAPSQTNAGTYTTYYRVAADGYETMRGSFTTTIARATPTLTLSATSGSTALPAATSFTYTYDGDGAVTAISSDGSIATVSVDAATKTITVTPTGVGTMTITVSAAESANCLAAAGVTYTLTVTPAVVNPTSTSGGSNPTTLPKTGDAAGGLALGLIAMIVMGGALILLAGMTARKSRE